MLKFVKEHMASIDGIEAFPLFSFIIFFAFFLVLGVWVFTTSKEHINKMKKLPLTENENSQE